jgi:tetratricopeptide (TPR) repeat protein
MIHTTTQRDLAEILRGFDPKHTVAGAISAVAVATEFVASKGYLGNLDHDFKHLGGDFQSFVDRKYDELDDYISAHTTDAPIEDNEIIDILYAWVYSQRVLLHEIYTKWYKDAAERREQEEAKRREEQKDDGIPYYPSIDESTAEADRHEEKKRNEYLNRVETAEIETSTQSDKQPNDFERDNKEIKIQEDELKIRTADENSVEPEDLNNLAEIYYQQGKYAEAEPLYVRSLAISEQTFGPTYPNTEKVRDKLETLRNENARIRTAQGSHVEAADLDSLAAFYEEN